MSDVLPDGQPADQSQSRLKALLNVSLTTAIITGADYIPAEWGELWAKLLRIFAPLLSYLISLYVAYRIRKFDNRQLEKRLIGYINELKAEQAASATSPTRRKEIIRQLALYDDQLLELRKRSLVRVEL